MKSLQIRCTEEQRELIKKLMHSNKEYGQTNAEVLIKALEEHLRGLNAECDSSIPKVNSELNEDGSLK